MVALLKILLPLFAGIISGFIKASNDQKHEQQKMILAKAGFEERSRKRAGKLEGVTWTRRYIAILFSTSFVVTLLILIFAGIFNPDFVINVPKEVYKHSIFSFIGFTNPTMTQEYITLKGVTIVAPLIEKLMIITEIIVGFYFGAKVNK